MAEAIVHPALRSDPERGFPHARAPEGAGGAQLLGQRGFAHARAPVRQAAEAVRPAERPARVADAGAEAAGLRSVPAAMPDRPPRRTGPGAEPAQEVRFGPGAGPAREAR